MCSTFSFIFFFFNDTATTEIYTLSLHDALPISFLAGLELTARYPEYLARPDEPLVPGPDLVAIPEGSLILTSDTASVALATAAWRRETGPAGRARLAVDGARFSGRLPAPPSASGTWLLDLAAADGTPLEGDEIGRAHV